MKNRRKLDKFAKRRIRLLIIVIAIIVTITFIISNKKNKKVYDEYRLIIGENYINLNDDMYIDNFNNIYLSKEDILKLYDSNIYYDQTENMLITTYNKHIGILYLDEHKVNINGSLLDVKASLINFNNKIYLPFSEMGIIYDFEYEYCQETKTVIVDSISEKKIEGKINRKSVGLKKQEKLFSSKIEKINKDETVTIFEELDKYYKVRSSKGNIGYISKKKIGDVQTVRDDMENSKIENINFLEYNDISKDYSDINIDMSTKNAVILDAFNIKNSTIEEKIDFSSNNYSNYIKWTEETDILPLANITCDDEIANAFLSYKKRELIIQELYNKLITNNLKGIVINFDKINDVNSFYRFVIELAPKFRESGIKTIVKYNPVLKEEKLDSIVDYIIE
ncbi:MAG: hypothetical protein ACI4UE_03245 [Candidatus Scatovivens sp.]